jgi:hypothetical protein
MVTIKSHSGEETLSLSLNAAFPLKRNCHIVPAHSNIFCNKDFQLKLSQDGFSKWERLFLRIPFFQNSI